MRASRIYIAAPLQVGSALTLDEDAAHYVRSVLRLKAEQTVILFNGQGGEYRCSLSEVSRKQVRAAVLAHTARDVESPLSIQLGLGISRGDRMDWSVQKAVELGVAALTPLLTERCVLKLTDDKKQQRLQHWQHIAQHAAEQSGRCHMPTLSNMQSLNEWLPAQSGLRVFLDPHAQQSLADLPRETRLVTLLTGPEGGFSDTERHHIQASGFTAVRLGARILRTETAVIAALTAAQTLWGDFH